MDMFTNQFKVTASDTIQVNSGATIMKEGEVGNCAYMLISGRLQIERQINDERVMVGEVIPVDIVGELAILEDIPRTATVYATQPSTLLVLNKHRLKTVIRRYPDIAEIIIKLLCSKLRKTSNRLIVSQSEVNQIKRKLYPKFKTEPMDQPVMEEHTVVKQEDAVKPETIAKPGKSIQRMATINWRELTK